MITIELKLFVTLSQYLPQDAAAYPVAEKTTIEKLIAGLNIPKDLVKLIFINGRRKEPDYILQSGDRLALFPPVGGG